MAIWWATAAKNKQRHVTGIGDLMWGPRGNSDGITSGDGKDLCPQRHHAFTGLDMIDLLALEVFMQGSRLSDIYRCLGQALIMVTVPFRMHQLSDLGTIFGLINRYMTVFCFQWVIHRSGNRRLLSGADKDYQHHNENNAQYGKTNKYITHNQARDRHATTGLVKLARPFL